MWEGCRFALEQVFTSVRFQSSAILLWVYGMYCIECSHFSSFHNADLQPRNVQFVTLAQASFIAQDVCIQTYDPVWSSRISHQMRYREPKKLVFRGVSFKDVLEICAYLQAECRIKHARYCLIIMIIQKYVKSMPICFARDRICAISIARIDLQMRYCEPKKLVFSSV